MTNKNIVLRIKALLSQNKHLRKKLKELEIKNKDLQEWIDIDNEISLEQSKNYFELYEKYSDLAIEYPYLQQNLEKARRQRNYYNRLVKDSRQQIKSMEENK